jgi:hypothetical protein
VEEQAATLLDSGSKKYHSFSEAATIVLPPRFSYEKLIEAVGMDISHTEFGDEVEFCEVEIIQLI